jgi:hypothetical protein
VAFEHLRVSPKQRITSTWANSLVDAIEQSYSLAASHGSRHRRGGEDPIDYSQVMRLFKKAASPQLGTGGALGPAASISPDPGFTRLLPLRAKVSIKGALASGESIRVVVAFAFDDGTSAYVEKAYAAAGDYYLTDADFFELWKDNAGVVRVDVQAGSTAPSTQAAVEVTVLGAQY